jgi:hypothetical protein
LRLLPEPNLAIESHATPFRQRKIFERVLARFSNEGEWPTCAHSPRELKLAPGESLRGTLVMRSVGWLVRRTRRAVTLAVDVYPDGRFRGISRIPWVLVRRIVPLLDVIEPAKAGKGQGK